MKGLINVDEWNEISATKHRMIMSMINSGYLYHANSMLIKLIKEKEEFRQNEK